MAVEDAYVLSALLAQVRDVGRIESAFEAFDAVRKERTQRLVRTSREAGRLQDFELEGVGDDVQKFGENMQGRMGWIWDVDLRAEVEEGERILSR